MDEVTRTSSPESSSTDTGRWIGRVVIAVILAEGIWGFIASLTNSLILPFLARTMGGDAQSPLYLGRGDVNVPALFASVLELCFAGIAAVILNSFLQRKPKMIRGKPARTSQVAALSIAPVQPTALPPSPPAVVPVKAEASVAPPITPSATYSTPEPLVPLPRPPVPSAPPSQFASTPAPAPPLKAVAPGAAPKAPAKPQKPKPPKEIYYNIVGEPINPTEDD